MLDIWFKIVEYFETLILDSNITSGKWVIWKDPRIGLIGHVNMTVTIENYKQMLKIL